MCHASYARNSGYSQVAKCQRTYLVHSMYEPDGRLLRWWRYVDCAKSLADQKMRSKIAWRRRVNRKQLYGWEIVERAARRLTDELLKQRHNHHCHGVSSNRAFQQFRSGTTRQSLVVDKMSGIDGCRGHRWGTARWCDMIM